MLETLDPILIERFAAALERVWPGDARTADAGVDAPHLGLAVSGGPDSVALMLLAAKVLPSRIAVMSIDHGLRAEAANEVAMVGQLCQRLNIPFTARKVSIASGNVQAGARAARYAALHEWAQGEGLGAIATAHHADDQTETLLMRLNRGSGLAGLAGVRGSSHLPDSNIALIRPLLWARKAELERLVEAAGIVAMRDPSNHDLTYDRVAMRAFLSAQEALNPAAIATSAEHLGEAARALDHYAQQDWADNVQRAGEGAGQSYSYRAQAPRWVQIETVSRIIAALDRAVTRSEAARAVERLSQGMNASLGGVLAKPDAGDVWRFSPEPPRGAPPSSART